MNYGATIISVKLPGQNGKTTDVVLGFDSLDGYTGYLSIQKYFLLSLKLFFSHRKPNPYFGAIVGRVANRIANGTFSIDGQKYNLAQNNGTNNLHGGLQGFDKVVWNAFVNADHSVTFTYHSKDGEEGFPGRILCICVQPS